MNKNVFGDSVTDVYDKCGETEFCEMKKGYGCTLGSPCPHQKPLTNFERITESPEALAAFIADVCYGLLDDVWSNGGDTSCDYPETEKNYWVEWLKQESKE